MKQGTMLDQGKSLWKSRPSRKKKQLIVLGLVIVLGFILLLQYDNRPDQIEVLSVNEEAVYASEAMVYYKLMELEFERMGSENIWKLDILGLDPQQTAMDRVMQSIIRVKVIQSLVGELAPEEEQEVQEKAKQLEALLGETYMVQHRIDRPLLEKVIRENYKAYRYQEDAKFLPGSNEYEIEQKLKEAFGRYELLDKEQYLRTVAVQPMMFYTGEWVEGEWVSYPEAQKAVILEEVEKLQKQINLISYSFFNQSYGDNPKVEDNPVFAQGAIQHELMSYNRVYYGQIEPKAAEAIFATGVGEVSDLIESEYGYLLVRVVSYPSVSENDMQTYERLLHEARENYRAQLMQELRTQRLEEEWRRLENESVIRRYDERWEEYVRSS